MAIGSLVTDEMIEAGVWSLGSFDLSRDDPAVIAESVFVAMLRASPPSLDIASSLRQSHEEPADGGAQPARR
jgi:hypothetical protein